MRPSPDATLTPAVARLKSWIGQGVDALETPALVIDVEALNRNMQRMTEFAAKHRVRLRPHAKTHKSGDIAHLQLQAGAVGVCVQTVAEAEALAARGVKDIFISNQVLAVPRLRRVAALAHQLAQRGGRLAIAVDSGEGVTRLAQAMNLTNKPIDVFLEIDVGQGRCGVPVGEAVVVLARLIADHAPRLHFAGLHAYHGGAQHVRSVAERRMAVSVAAEGVAEARDLLRGAGIEVPLITGAGTGSFGQEAASGLWGELQAGSFIFMDADYALNERDPAQPVFEHALFLKSQVISARGEQVVVDAGHKSHAVDSGLPLVHSLPGQPAMVYANGGDEHGILRLADGAEGQLPALGDTVWLIPGHCDPTVNLHDAMFAVRDGLAGGVVESIVWVDARGYTG